MRRFPLPRTLPRQWQDIFLWPILRITWDLLTRKDVHFWHWRDYQGPIQLPLQVAPDPSAGGRQGFLDNLLNTDLHKGVVVVRPKDYDGEYQIGFHFLTGPKRLKQLCAVILKGPTALTTAPYEQELFALTLQGEPLPIELVRYTTRDDLGESIPLI